MQVPEGFYTIAPGQMNPNSHYYLSFNVGYPNAYDRALGRTGGDIMVHGVCSSAGCFSMTDAQIGEIYAIAREAFNGGERAIQMQSYPLPHDRREPRQASARSQYRVLERAEERRRPFRGDEERAFGAGVRQALRLRRERGRRSRREQAVPDAAARRPGRGRRRRQGRERRRRRRRAGRQGRQAGAHRLPGRRPEPRLRRTRSGRQRSRRAGERADRDRARQLGQADSRRGEGRAPPTPSRRRRPRPPPQRR